jgi:hypothetical protein
MSKSLLNRFVLVDRLFKHSESTDETVIRFLFGATIFGIHGVYVASTNNNETIVVSKKYKMSQFGNTEFMIIDKEGRHFNVNNSFWYFKWNSIEDWHKIEEKKEYSVKYYGIRVPCLGVFPNIVKSV